MIRAKHSLETRQLLQSPYALLATAQNDVAVRGCIPTRALRGKNTALRSTSCRRSPLALFWNVCWKAVSGLNSTTSTSRAALSRVVGLTQARAAGSARSHSQARKASDKAAGLGKHRRSMPGSWASHWYGIWAALTVALCKHGLSRDRAQRGQQSARVTPLPSAPGVIGPRSQMLCLWKWALEVVKEVFTAQFAKDKETRYSSKVGEICLSVSFFFCCSTKGHRYLKPTSARNSCWLFGKIPVSSKTG